MLFRFRLVILAALALVALASPSFAMSQGCSGDCASCHSITLDEAKGVMKGIATVKEVKPSAVRGLYELTLEKDGTTGVAYLDYSKKYLIGGQIYDIAARQLVSGAPPAKKPAEHLDPSTLTTDHTVILGNPKGSKKLFVFTDPECPFCSKMHEELKKLVTIEPDLTIYIKLLPLKIHPHAYDKARLIIAKRSLKLLELSYAGKSLPTPGAHEGKAAVDENIRYAESVGIFATPTLVFADGRVKPGVLDAKSIKALLQ
ncbi:thiol:disulfide interchange protein [Geomonas sp. Red276]